MVSKKAKPLLPFMALPYHREWEILAVTRFIFSMNNVIQSIIFWSLIPLVFSPVMSQMRKYLYEILFFPLHIYDLFITLQLLLRMVTNDQTVNTCHCYKSAK